MAEQKHKTDLVISHSTPVGYFPLVFPREKNPPNSNNYLNYPKNTRKSAL
jgi:hypothetical protein